MKKMRSFFRSSMGTTFMFMLAVLLLMTGTIGGVRAAPQIFNPNFAYSGVELDQIGITLMENGNAVSSRDYNKETEAFDYWSNSDKPKMGILVGSMLGEGEKLKLGKAYDEKLSVYNSGSIPEFVRVTVYKYWVDKDGNRFDAYDSKGNDMINKLIKLNFLESNGWVIDGSSTTKERTVLYYQNLLEPKKSTPDFTDTLTIDSSIMDYGKKVYKTEGNETSWTWSWVVDGMKFMIEAEADGVQNHNATAAVKSAWGLTDADITRLGLKLS